MPARIKLPGHIDENTPFAELLQPAAGNGEVEIDCSGVTRVNSIGIRSWVAAFGPLRKQGTKIRLLQCTPALVEQFGMMTVMAEGEEVQSIFLPFVCEECGAESRELVERARFAELRRSATIPPGKCAKCGGQAVFDDLPEQYFSFLDG